MTTPLQACAGALLAALCGAAGAQGLPKQFNFKVTYSFLANPPSPPVQLGGDNAATAMTLTMSSTNDAGEVFMGVAVSQSRAQGFGQKIGSCNVQ